MFEINYSQLIQYEILEKLAICICNYVTILLFSPEQTSGLKDFLNIVIQTSGLPVLILFLKPTMLQTLDLERSDRNCHFKSDNYILILRMPED